MDRTGQGQPFSPRSVVPAFDLLEFLHEPNSRVARFHQGELFWFQISKSFSQVTKEVMAFPYGQCKSGDHH